MKSQKRQNYTKLIFQNLFNLHIKHTCIYNVHANQGHIYGPALT